MIGDRIKQARLNLGYSAEQVAAFLNVSPATIYRYENGDISKLPSKYIKPLAEFLCISPSSLMGWDEKDISDDYLKYLAENAVESQLIADYRSLSLKGKNLLLERVKELKLLYGNKPE